VKPSLRASALPSTPHLRQGTACVSRSTFFWGPPLRKHPLGIKPRKPPGSVGKGLVPDPRDSVRNTEVRLMSTNKNAFCSSNKCSSVDAAFNSPLGGTEKAVASRGAENRVTSRGCPLSRRCRNAGEEKRIGRAAVDAIVHFQKTGEKFDVLWSQIEPDIASAVCFGLRKRLVTGVGGSTDQAAVNDCNQEVVMELLRIGAGELGGGFDPERCSDPVRGPKSWLSRVAMNEVENYCRNHRGARSSLKMISFGDVEMNPGSPGHAAITKDAAKYDCDAFEVMDTVRECVAALSEDDRTLYRWCSRRAFLSVRLPKSSILLRLPCVGVARSWWQASPRLSPLAAFTRLSEL